MKLWSLSAGAVTAAAVTGLAVTPVAADPEDNTLRIAQSRPLDTLDPYLSITREVYAVIGEMLFDTLIFEDPRTNTYEPLLAESWEWIDDTTLNLKLREGVEWHDGSPFTADDVLYTFDYILDEENPTARYDQYNMISGAEKLGEYEVQITLDHPYGPIMPTLAARIQILPEGFYDGGTTPDRLIGTGPYKYVSHTPGGGATLELNEDYFEGGPKGQPTIETFEYVYIPETSTQIAELMVGNIDWIWRITNEEQERLDTVEEIETTSAGTLRTHFLYFDATGRSGDTPVADVKVRQAISHAIDRDTIATTLVRGGEEGLKFPCHPSHFGCPPAEELTQYDYDPEAARALLEEAGYPDGFDVDMWFFNSYQHELAQAMQANLRDVGINANLNPATPTVLYEGTGEGTVEMAWVASAAGSILDVASLYGLFFGTDRDLTHDEEINALIQEGDSISDEARRKEIYLEVAQKIMSEAYWLPLWIEGGLYAFDAHLDYTAWDDENPRFYLASWK